MRAFRLNEVSDTFLVRDGDDCCNMGSIVSLGQCKGLLLQLLPIYHTQEEHAMDWCEMVKYFILIWNFMMKKKGFKL